MMRTTLFGSIALAVSHTATPSDLLVPSQYPSIQSAINASAPGDRVLVSPGTYYETVYLSGRLVILESAAGADVTTIDGELQRQVILGSGEPQGCVVRGFTIARGSHSNLTGAGGMTLLNSAAKVVGCRFVGNQSIGCYPSAAWGAGAFYSEYGTPVIEQCEFVGNHATYSGAGIYHYLGGHLTVRDSSFVANQVDWLDCHDNLDNGVVHIQNQGGPISSEISGCRFDGNLSQDGRCISVWAPGGSLALVVSDCDFLNPVYVEPDPNPPADRIRAPLDAHGYMDQTSLQWTVSQCYACGFDGLYQAGQQEQLVPTTVVDCTLIPKCTPCPADISGDGTVDGVDLGNVLALWGTDGQGAIDADINDDLVVDGFDLGIMLANWGPCSP